MPFIKIQLKDRQTHSSEMVRNAFGITATENIFMSFGNR